MNTEDFWKSKEINTFEKLLFVYLQFNEFKSVKDLALIFSVSEVTLRRAFAKLRKLELISKSGVSKLILNNNGCIKSDTNEKSECINIDTNCIKSDTKSIKTDTNSEKNTHIYINTNNINNTNSINKEEGKSSLTSFASTSRRNFTTNSEIVNDLGHKNLNQIKNSLPPTEPAKTSLAEIVKAPTKQKKPKKTKTPFVPPTYEAVLGFMAAYVQQEQSNFPELIEINLNIEAKKYMNFYSGKDWRLGVIKMTDWRIQASNWLMGKVEKITEGRIKIKKNQQYIQEAFGNSFLDPQNIVDLNQVQNADGTITAETPAIQTSFPIFQQTKTKEQLKKETDDFIQKHKSGEVL